MKKTFLIVLLASVLLPCELFAENLTINTVAPTQNPAPQVRFDLNFPGGSPQDLVAAIEKASGKPLNAIIPSDCKDIQIPPLKMSQVTVEQLFEALKTASIKQVNYQDSDGRLFTRNTYYSFESSGGDNNVWSFKADRVPQQILPKDICRFYQLEPLLQKYKIEDITTAIKTGWEMLNITHPPQLKFHPETKLLIAVGREVDLRVIENVLNGLKPSEVPKLMPRPSVGDPLPKQP